MSYPIILNHSMNLFMDINSKRSNHSALPKFPEMVDQEISIQGLDLL